MVETSCHVIKNFTMYLLVVIENIDRSDDCYTNRDVSYKENAFPLLQRLHERASILCYTYITTLLVLCVPDIARFKSVSCRFVILSWVHSNQGRVVWYFRDGLFHIKNVSFCISEMA